MDIKIALKALAVIFTLSVLGLDSKAASAGALPCDLNQINYKPILKLHGETHNDSNSQMSKMVEMMSAAKGKEFLALEGFFYDQPQDAVKWTKALGLWTTESRVFGFDAEFPYGLSVMMSIDLSLSVALSKKKDGTLPKDKADQEIKLQSYLMILHLHNNPYMKEAWDLWIQHQGKMSQLEEKILILVNTFPEDEVVQSKVALFSGDEKNLDDLQMEFFKTMRGVEISYAIMAMSDKYKTKMNTPPDIMQILTKAIVEGEYSAAADRLAVGWRNESIIRNLAQLYCQASLEKKDLVVVIGSLHVPGVKKAFEEMSKNQITIKVVDTTQPLPGFKLPGPPVLN